MSEKHNYTNQAMDDAIQHGVAIKEREVVDKKIRKEVAKKEIIRAESAIIPEDIKSRLFKSVFDCRDGEISIDEAVKQIREITVEYQEKYKDSDLELLNEFISYELTDASGRKAKDEEKKAAERGFIDEKIYPSKPSALDKVWEELFEFKVQQRKKRK